MKLDRYRSSRLLAVAIAAALPVSAALASDLQESLKTLNTRVHATPDMRAKAASENPYAPSSSQGAMGPQGTQRTYPSDMGTTPQGSDEYKYETAPSAEPPVLKERSP